MYSEEFTETTSDRLYYPSTGGQVLHLAANTWKVQLTAFLRSQDLTRTNSHPHTSCLLKSQMPAGTFHKPAKHYDREY